MNQAIAQVKAVRQQEYNLARLLEKHTRDHDDLMASLSLAGAIGGGMVKGIGKGIGWGWKKATATDSRILRAGELVQNAQEQRKQGDVDTALRLYEDALEYMKRIPPRLEHAWELRAQSEMGMIYFEMEEYSKSQTHYERALSLAKTKYGKKDVTAATLLNFLGVVSLHGKEAPKAIEYFHQALKIREAKLGKLDSKTIGTYDSLAIAYQKDGEYNEAIQYFGKVLKQLLQTSGKDSRRVADVYVDIG